MRSTERAGGVSAALDADRTRTGAKGRTHRHT